MYLVTFHHWVILVQIKLQCHRWLLLHTFITEKQLDISESVVYKDDHGGYHCIGATRHKYTDGIGEVWSASSPPLSGDALPSFPTQRKRSFTESPTLSLVWRTAIRSVKALRDRSRRDSTPERELWLIRQVMRKKAHRSSWRSVTVLDVPLCLWIWFSNDNFFPMRNLNTMRILWVFVLWFLDLSGKGEHVIRLVWVALRNGAKHLLWRIVMFF